MNLKEATNRCKGEQYDFPEIIDSKSGLGEFKNLGIVGIPAWNRKREESGRKAILEIRTWKGISSNAIHYYGKIVADGVYIGDINNVEISKDISFELLRNHPLLNYNYSLHIFRPLTEEELEKDPNRWEGWDEGDLVKGYEVLDDLISDAKSILKLRFIGDWNFFMQTPRGVKSRLFNVND